MTPSQEVANAFSMLLPTLVLAYHGFSHDDHNNAHWKHLLLLGSCVHLPVSFTYHLGVAYGRYNDPIDNDMRRLDQTLQHVACVLFSYALSHGSVGYMLMNLGINLAGMIWLWDPQTSNDRRRWRPIFVCGVLYLLPVMARGDVLPFIVAFSAFLLGGTAAFVFNGSGYGSLFLHVMMAVHVYALLQTV